ncbi:MAG: hypothetical protein ACREFQ_08545 [Stellaceae bacterium]
MRDLAVALHTVFLLGGVLAFLLLLTCALLPRGLSPIRPSRRR